VSNRGRRAALVALVVLALAYPVGANLVLALGGVQKAFEGTDSVKVDFRRAWSFWPGRVHVEDLRVTMYDHNVQFVLTMPSVDVRVALGELVHRRFHATRVRGSGVVFRFRNRIQPESAGLPFVAALPPVPGFPDPPIYESGPPPPPLDEAHYNLWTIHIEDVDVEVREIWAQMFRYQGAGRAIGAFRLRPAKRLWVGPAELHLASGTIASGPTEVANAVRADITCKVDDFDVENVHGLEPFRFISARTVLALAVPDLSAVDFLAGPGSKVAFRDGGGALDADARLEHGVIQSESRVTYRTSRVGVVTPAARFAIEGDLALTAARADSDRGEVSVDVPSARVRLDGARGPPLEIRDVRGALFSSSVDVTRPSSFAGGSGSLTAVFDELAAAGDLPGARSLPLYFKRGRAEAHLTVAASDDRAIEGTLEGHAERAEVCHESGFCFATPKLGLSADGDIRPGKRPRGRFRLEVNDVTAERGATRWLAAFVSSQGTFSSAGVSGKIGAREVRIGSMGSCPSASIGGIEIEGSVATPRRGPLEAEIGGRLQKGTFRWGSFQLASLGAAFSGSWDGSLFSADVRSGPLDLKSSGGAPKGWQGAVESARVQANLRVSGEDVRGPTRIEIKRFVGRVGRAGLEGDVIAALEVQSNATSLKVGDLSGVVQARNVTVRTRKRNVDNYWAEVALRPLHVDARQNLDFSGVVNARFQNALPALSVLASDDAIPGWTTWLLPRHMLTLDLEVERFCRWTDVQIVEAEHGPIYARGRFQAQPGDTRGALLFHVPGFLPLSLGVEFANDSTHSSAFVGKGWLEKRLAPLTRAASSRHDTKCPPEPPTCE
jgi:hypothetical protein